MAAAGLSFQRFADASNGPSPDSILPQKASLAALPALGWLAASALRPEFIYNHNWVLGDMLIWDNRSALHKANYDYDPLDTTQERKMYRMLIKGERPH